MNWQLFSKLWQREILLLWRKPVLIVQPLLLFMIMVMTFPLALSNLQILPTTASPICWFALMFAMLISLEHLWGDDEKDGSLTQLLLSPVSLTVVVYVKMFVHWLACGLPVLILLPIVLTFYHVPVVALPTYVLSFAISSLTMSLLGCLLASIFVRIQHASLLLPGILLLLFIPLGVLTNSLIHAHLQGLPTISHYLFLLALLTTAFTIAPLATSAILKFTAE